MGFKNFFKHGIKYFFPKRSVWLGIVSSCFAFLGKIKLLWTKESEKKTDKLKPKTFLPARFENFRFYRRKRTEKLKSRYKGKNSSGFTEKDAEEWKLYTLNRFQLKNLVDKNIHFHFFQLEDFDFFCDKDTKLLLEKAKRVTEDELVSELRGYDLKRPIVLICERGLVSKRIFEALGKKGFVNVYFVEGGLRKILEEK